MHAKLFKKSPSATFVASVLLATALTGCIDDSDSTTPKTGEGTYTLQLLHMADMDGSNAEALANAGNFASNVDALRNTYPENTLFLSSGDNYIPGARYEAGAHASMSNVAGVGTPGNGRADIALVNAMGLQASAVGNHDLDGGTAEFASIIDVDNAYVGAQFPYLSANMDFSVDANTAHLVTEDGQIASTIPNSLASTTIIEVNGEQIGIIGATTPKNEVLTDTGTATVLPESDLTVDLAEIIQAQVDTLTATGINKVIVLAHMQSIAIEKELATLLTGVDIIVAGGSNTRLADENDRLWPGDTAADEYPLLLKSADDKDIAVVNVDGDYKYLGRLVVDFNAAGELLVDSIDSVESGTYVSDDEMVAQLGAVANAEVDTIVDAINDVIVASESNILGHTSVYLNGIKEEVRAEETNLGNLTAEANLWYAQLADESVQISIKNGGGIRASIGYVGFPAGSTDENDLQYYPPAAYPNAGKAEGDISQYDLQSALAFNNSLSTLTMTATELKAIIEHTVAEIDPNDPSGYAGGQFAQIAGMTFTFDATLVAGERVTDLAVDSDADGSYDDVVIANGVIEGDAARTFNAVTLSYIAEGGDGYPFPCTADAEGACTDHRYLEGSMDNVDPAQSDFANAGTEQDALAEYLLATYPTADSAYAEADTIADEEAVDTVIIRTN